MYYVGVDLHKKTSWFHVLDENGKRVDSKNISNSHSELKKYLSEIPRPYTLAVETTFNWYFFVDLASKFADKVLLADAFSLKAFAKQHKKNDKIDSRLIAFILWKGCLPQVTIADPKTRQIRELLRYRMNIVKDRTRNILRLKSFLDKIGADSTGNFSTYKTLDNLQLEEVSDTYKQIIKKYSEQIKFLIQKTVDIDKQVKKLANYDQDIWHLMSIDGIGPFSAAIIKSEIIDINRFASFNRLCAYAGLAPRVFASANKIYHGPLNVNRRKNLQWVLLEDVYQFIKHNPKKEAKFIKIKQRKGHNTAKVALARDLLKMVYHILKDKRPYYPENKYPVGSDTRTLVILKDSSTESLCPN